MKKIEQEDVLASQKQVTSQFQKLINSTTMEDEEDRKRTANYCDWISKKTEMIIAESTFNHHDPIYDGIKRGSVVWVEFGFNIGAEFGGKGSSIFVLPLSSQQPSQIKPYHVKIDKVYGFKNLTRWTNVLKLINVSLQRVDITASIGNVKGTVLDDINEAIKNTHVF